MSHVPKLGTARRPQRLVVLLTLLIELSLVAGLVLFILRDDLENVLLTLLVIALIAVPAIVLRRSRIHVPPEFQLVAAVFTWLTLYLGSAADFYYHFWWWDMVMHLSAGFIFGIVGWVVMFLLLQTDRLPRSVSPALAAAFGITFAVTIGVFWEFFEFAVDWNWPYANMMSHETGVRDTIKDLFVDTVGAVAVGLMGYAYARGGRFSWVVDAVRRFTRANPRLFRKRRRRPVGTTHR